MFSEPAIGEKFFGREDVLELLNKRASALKDGYRQNVALTGQSLAGKSSIILRFLHTIQEEGFIPIYVEVVRESFRSFANKFIATMLYNALTGKIENVDIELSGLLANAQTILPKTSQAIKQVNELIDDGETEEAYPELLGLTSTLKAETGTPCIVILDEFDNLERLGIKNPYLSFGKVIMVQKDTMYIVSSSRNLAIRKIISEKLSLLFGNFEVIKVANFTADASCRFMEAKLSPFDIDDFIKKFLIAFTDGNPFYLDRLVTRSAQIAAERMTSHIDTGVVAEAIVDTAYNSDGSIHQYLMSYMLDLLGTKCRDLCTAVLVEIAGGQNKQALIAKTLKTKQGEISKALAYLMEKALISKSGVFYRIDDVMFEFWLEHVYRRKKEMLVDGTFNRREFFKAGISSYMKAFEKEFTADHTSRLAELFASFSDELVELEMKNMRLPRFTKVEVKTIGSERPFITASFRGSSWVAQPFDEIVNENNIVNFIRNVKTLDLKIVNKVILPLKGIDENAKLLAKELRISIWDGPTVNMLLTLYGKKRVVAL